MKPLPRYSPHHIAPADRGRLLVGREPLLTEIVKRAASTATGGGARFELLLGPPGMGTSHLLLAAHDRALETLGGRVAVALLEGTDHLGSLATLLVAILRVLSGPAEPAAEGELLTRVRQTLGERPLLVFVEHLDRALRAMGQAGQQRLRALLQNEARWSIVGTARDAEAFTDQNRPFFAMFAIRDLAELNARECRGLLVQRAALAGDEPLAAFLRSATGLARARALHVQLGGLPARWAALSRYLTPERADGLRDALLELLDEWTPRLHQHLAWLPEGRRAVFEHLLYEGRPLTVNQLAERLTDASPQTVSSQLGVLRQEGLVRFQRVGRESFYEPADPMYRSIGELTRHPERFLRRVELLRTWHVAPGESLQQDRSSQGFQLLGDFSQELVDRVRGALAQHRPPRAPREAWSAAQRALAQGNAAERLLLLEALAAEGWERLDRLTD